jgi:uncharacterized membrane protein YgaE (UPF0421/DUF939 family)
MITIDEDSYCATVVVCISIMCAALLALENPIIISQVSGTTTTSLLPSAAVSA